QFIFCRLCYKGWYEDNWYEVNLGNEGITCTVEQMRMAAEGHLTTEALMWNQNNQTTISGMTAEEFRLRLNHALIEEGYDINHDRYPEGYQEAPLAYDAVWSVALAFNKTMERLKRRNKSLKEFTYNDKDIADEIYAAMNSTQFLGVSGVVAFSSQGDRIALTQIEQMINGRYEKLGYYDTQLDNLTWLNMEQWIGGKVSKLRFKGPSNKIIRVPVSISNTQRKRLPLNRQKRKKQLNFSQLIKVQ
uniref:Receptor ligand binding region domain-containing protein n=1 Tax=Glossina palpalis gambiensis TaxID=67801 RepID=A0A1B0BPN1_9MUSC